MFSSNHPWLTYIYSPFMFWTLQAGSRLGFPRGWFKKTPWETIEAQELTKSTFSAFLFSFHRITSCDSLPTSIHRYNSFIMLIFGGILIVSFVYVYFLIPETKGLTLEQVDEMYESRVAPWKSASWQPSTGRRNRNNESTNKA